MKQKWENRITNILIMTAGAIVQALAVALVIDPNSMAPGGVTGIAIIMNRVTQIETGTLIWCLNVPILIMGTWKFGWKFIVSTLYCTGLVSVLTNIFSAVFPPLTQDIFLASIVGGALMAVGIGLVFKAGATTGGTDIIVKVFRVRMPHLKTGALFLSIDAVIVFCSIFVFKNVDRALYSGITVMVSSMVLDVVLYGKDSAKLIYIISDHAEEIAKRLLEELDLGVTYVRGSGAYSGKDKQVIMCAVKKHMAPKTEEVVKQEDPLAFMIVTSAMEIYGEGYKNLFSEKL